ncbi:hypothetical protein OV203_04875 [Nannocystis sp. ILAH1]|uniref:hypothetical protein n=1 Tax=unclassified Nannocystis TaxID=2627009 RepID=UPI00227216D8|nr:MULTISPECIES: hypothetical protein [unclassified Nannocystis]MCY0986439.1 hypothetical protein [Nannocystis sp. ILAH1]MCY1071319.1 hypothetical protein [Nannocystis sp. RBIL2]
MSAIGWNSNERRKLHGWRSAHEAEPDDAAPNLAEAWSRLGEVKLPKLKGNASAIAAAVAKSLKQAKPPKRLTIPEEVLRATLVFRPPNTNWEAWENWAIARALVALWTEVGGFRFAVDVLSSQPLFYVIRTLGLDGAVAALEIDEVGEPETENARGPWDLAREMEPLWWALRCRVSTMSEAELAKACASCEDLLDGVPAGKTAYEGSDEGGHWWRRAMLTFVLSRNTSLAAEQIDRLMKAVGRSGWGGAEILMAAAPDARRAAAIAERAASNGLLRLGDYAFDIVEALGSDAAPILEKAYAHARKVSAKQYLVAHEQALNLAQGKALSGAKRVAVGEKKPAKKASAGKKPSAGKKAAKKAPAAKKAAKKAPAAKKAAKKAPAAKKAAKKAPAAKKAAKKASAAKKTSAPKKAVAAKKPARAK